jgi:hypothetical protein
VVRLFLTFAIALYLSGVPAVAAVPCAGGTRAAGAHACCLRHQAERGGPAIGSCGCLPNQQSAESGSTVSTAAGSSESFVATMTVTAGPAEFAPALPHVTMATSVTAPDSSPPLLTVLGLRC